MQIHQVDKGSNVAGKMASLVHSTHGSMKMKWLLFCCLVILMAFSSNGNSFRHCELSSLPVFPTESDIATALQSLDLLEWVHAKQQMHYSHQIPRVMWLNAKVVAKRVPPHHIQMLTNNSDFKYIPIDDESAELFLNTVFRNTSYLWAFHSLNEKLGAGRADFFRYAVLYVFGGVYLDSDAAFFKSLDEFILPNDQFIVGVEGNLPFSKECYNKDFFLSNNSYNDKKFLKTLPWVEREVAQAMLITKPKHPFLMYTMKNIVEVFRQLKCVKGNKVFVHDIEKQNKLLCSTGPALVTASLRQCMWETPREEWPSLGIRYAGIYFRYAGGKQRVSYAHDNGRTSKTYWKKLMDNGTSLLADFEV